MSIFILRPKVFDVHTGKIVPVRNGGVTLSIIENRFRYSICSKHLVFSERNSKIMLKKEAWFKTDETVVDIPTLQSFLMEVFVGTKQTDLIVEYVVELLDLILEIQESEKTASETEIAKRDSIAHSGATRYKYAN